MSTATATKPDVRMPAVATADQYETMVTRGLWGAWPSQFDAQAVLTESGKSKGDLVRDVQAARVAAGLPPLVPVATALQVKPAAALHGLDAIDGTHATQDHRGIQQSVDPGQAPEIVIAAHTHAQGGRDDAPGDGSKKQQPADEVTQRSQFVCLTFETHVWWTQQWFADRSADEIVA